MPRHVEPEAGHAEDRADAKYQRPPSTQRRQEVVQLFFAKEADPSRDHRERKRGGEDDRQGDVHQDGDDHAERRTHDQEEDDADLHHEKNMWPERRLNQARHAGDRPVVREDRETTVGAADGGIEEIPIQLMKGGDGIDSDREDCDGPR